MWFQVKLLLTDFCISECRKVLGSSFKHCITALWEFHFYLLFIIIYAGYLGGVVTSWWVCLSSLCSSPGQRHCVVLLTRHLTLWVSLSTKEYKWVSANWMLGATLPLTTILSGGRSRNSPVASCYRNGSAAWWTTWKSQKTVFSGIFYTRK